MSEYDEIFRNTSEGTNKALDQSDQDCAEFQASMADRIMVGEDLQLHLHMLTCERCRSLVGELETIAEFARQLLPTEVEPRDDLWALIESKLALEGSEPSEPREEAKETKGDVPLAGDLALEGGIA
jgi:hypothetical protein